ncbi:MAG TPA: hypothetical protein VG965_03750 [Patescibacteria group bacterium]|nr:hypothetical protein [Patescibacteria group bacterium]
MTTPSEDKKPPAKLKLAAGVHVGDEVYYRTLPSAREKLFCRGILTLVAGNRFIMRIMEVYYPEDTQEYVPGSTITDKIVGHIYVESE